MNSKIFENILEFIEPHTAEFLPLVIAGILAFIIVFIPIKFKTYYIGSNITRSIKMVFWSLISVWIALNFLIYFGQPSYNEHTMSLERERQNINIKVEDYETDKVFVFTPKLYKFLTNMPDELYYRDITNYIWNNSFLINSYIILFFTLYVFVFKTVLNVKFFKADF